jgi:hypothetical protein
MPERWDQDEQFLDRYHGFDASHGTNGTGPHRGMARNPRRSASGRRASTNLGHDPLLFEEEERPRRKRRWRWLLFAGLLAICGLCTFMGAFAAVNLGIGIGTSKDAAITAGEFLGALGTQDYVQAYKYLGPPMTLEPGSQENFISQAQRYDACFGTVTDYKQVENSTIVQDNTWTSTYEITRSKLSRSYHLTLTLQQDSNQHWQIVDYKSEGADNALAPAQPVCD